MPPLPATALPSFNSVDDVLAFLQDHPLEVAVAVGLLILPWIIRLVLQPSAPKPWLDATEFKALALSSKEWLNHNTLKLRFNLPNPKQRLGLPIGQHISFRAKDSDGKDVYRSYTPVSDDDLLGAVEFVIKIYPNGKMSQVLKQLEVGQTLDMKGPKVGSLCLLQLMGCNQHARLFLQTRLLVRCC
jgi:cytochrome-b5 reductase